jgi:hypothetical protein
MHHPKFQNYMCPTLPISPLELHVIASYVLRTLHMLQCGVTSGISGRTAISYHELRLARLPIAR